MNTSCVLCHRPTPLVPERPLCPCGGVPAVPRLEPYDPRGLPRESSSQGVWRHAAALRLPPLRPDLPSLGESQPPLDPFVLPEAPPGVLLARGDLEPAGTIVAAGACLLAGTEAAVRARVVHVDDSADHALALARFAEGTRLRVTARLTAASPARLGLLERAGVRLVEHAPAGALDAAAARQPLYALGGAAVAWSIVERLGSNPGAVIVPVASGTLLAGLAAGFDAAARGGAGQVPRVIGVQPAKCAPLALAFERRMERVEAPPLDRALFEPDRRRAAPSRDVETLRAVRASGGVIAAVDAVALERAVRILWRIGVKVEPWAALPVAWLLSRSAPALLCGLEPIVAVVGAAGVRNGTPLVDGFPR